MRRMHSLETGPQPAALGENRRDEWEQEKKIRIEAKGKHFCSKYFGMDGHVENWSPILITALNQTTPRAILESRQLLKFMFDDYESDDHLDYLCEVQPGQRDGLHADRLNENQGAESTLSFLLALVEMRFATQSASSDRAGVTDPPGMTRSNAKEAAS